MPQKFRGELFSLTRAHYAWYPYDMHNCHPTPPSPASAELARPPLPSKTIFDGTKLSVERRRPKTTTNGINSPFRLFSMTRISHNHGSVRMLPDSLAFVSRAPSRERRRSCK